MSRSKARKLPEPLLATIDSLSHDGRGIARVNGKTVFVDQALPGETAKLKYFSSRSKYDEAVAIEIIDASSHRIVPECQYFTVCGGCSLQHMQQEYQIAHKQQVLLEQLKHIGHVESREILPAVTGSSWSYRRKARLGVKHVHKKAKTLVGFRERRKPYIADIDECKVLHPLIGNTISPLKGLIHSLSIKTQIPQIEVAIGDDHAAIVIRHLAELSDDDIARLQRFAEVYALDIYLQGNQKGPILALSTSYERPVSYVIDEFGINIAFKPLDFTQVNFEINKKMISLVVALMEPEKSESILDLFCGIGNFTLPLATVTGHVTGIEGSPALVESARANAESNGIQNINFRCMDLYAEDSVPDILRNDYDKVLMDPPRSGAREVVDTMDFCRIKRVVYVSCNPATLARDAGILVQKKGYELIKAGVIDMFPHTAHIESVAVFEKI
jgi:23S rRNA (uracil1939-C5)-methyltransferase